MAEEGAADDGILAPRLGLVLVPEVGDQHRLRYAGLPVRYEWAREYRGCALVVYGHTPVPDPEWLNNTIDIDTGYVFGGRLTALRYPERELVTVPAAQVYCEPARPLNYRAAALLPAVTLNEGDLSAQQQHDDLLDIRDVTGSSSRPACCVGSRFGKKMPWPLWR